MVIMGRCVRNPYTRSRFSIVNTLPRGRREQTTALKITNVSKMQGFRDYIWNQNKKCSQISTNMPGIGPVVCETGFEFKEFIVKNKSFHYKKNPIAAS